MKLSHQRLAEILEQLQDGQAISDVTRAEWTSMATELVQLRLRTSSESRSAAASKTAGAL